MRRIDLAKAFSSEATWGMVNRFGAAMQFAGMGAVIYAAAMGNHSHLMWLIWTVGVALLIQMVAASRILATRAQSLSELPSPFADPPHQREIDEAIHKGFRVFSSKLIRTHVDDPVLMKLAVEGYVVTGQGGITPDFFNECWDTSTRRRRQIRRVNEQATGAE